MKTWFEEMDFAIKERSRIADGRVISKDKRLKLYSDFMERAIQLCKLHPHDVSTKKDE